MKLSMDDSNQAKLYILSAVSYHLSSVGVIAFDCAIKLGVRMGRHIFPKNNT